MRKATACAALLLLLGVGASGCSVRVSGTPAPNPTAVAAPPTPPPAAPENLVRDAQGRFGLVPPPGWTVDTSGVQGTAVVFVDPHPTETSAGRFSANINVVVGPSTADLRNTVLGTRRYLQGLTDYRLAVDEPVALADGTPAHMIGGSFRDPTSGYSMRNIQLLTVHDGLSIVVTGTSFEEAWNVYEGAFDSSLRSLVVVT